MAKKRLSIMELAKIANAEREASYIESRERITRINSPSPQHSDRSTVPHAVQHSNQHSEPLTVPHSVPPTDTPTDTPPPNQHSDRSTVPHAVQHSNQHSDQSTDDPVHWLTERQAIILKFLIQNESNLTRLRDVTQNTDIPKGTVRDSLRVLEKYGFISHPERFRRGRFQGFSYSPNKEKCTRFMKIRGDTIPLRLTVPQTVPHAVQHSDRPLNFPENPTPIKKIDRRYIYLSKDARATLLNANPVLGEIGFEDRQLKEVIEAWKILGQDLTTLPESLERVTWAIENDSKDNPKIDNALNYVYGSLKKGPFAKLKGFVSKKEKALQEKIDEEQRLIDKEQQIKEKQKELKNLKFENWWNNLTQKERNNIDKTSKFKLTEGSPVAIAHRMNHFEKREGEG